MSSRTRILVLVVWTFLVLCMIPLGYGSDTDSWRVAWAATRTWSTGSYNASRSSGFPLFELLTTPLVRLAGWYGSNLLAMLSGIGAIAALFHLARKNALRHPLWCVIAIAFQPAVLCASSSTIDYVPGLALLLWSFCMLRAGHNNRAAVLIGLACGVRPTNLFLIAPACAYILATHSDRSWLAAGKVVSIAGAVGTLAYSPFLLRYGVFSPYGKGGTLTEELIARAPRALELLGPLPTAALLFSIVYFTLRDRRFLRASPWTAECLFHLVNIGLWLSLFALLPHEPEYLLPALPSLVLLADRVSPTWAMTGICVLLMSHHIGQVTFRDSSFFPSIALGADQGYTIGDVEDRLFKISTRSAADRFEAERPTLLVMGSWIWMANSKWEWDPTLKIYRQKKGRLYMPLPPIQPGKLQELADAGLRICIWRSPKWQRHPTLLDDVTGETEIVDDLSAFFGTKIRGRQLARRWSAVDDAARSASPHGPRSE